MHLSNAVLSAYGSELRKLDGPAMPTLQRLQTRFPHYKTEGDQKIDHGA